MFLRSFGKVPFRTISSAQISHNNELDIYAASLRDFGVIFLNVPFSEQSKFFFQYHLALLPKK